MNKEELKSFIDEKKLKPKLKENIKGLVKFEKVLRKVQNDILYLKQHGLTFNDIVEYLEYKKNIKISKKILIYFYKKEILNNRKDTFEKIIKESSVLDFRFNKIMKIYKDKKIKLKGLIYKISNFSISNGKLHLGITTRDKSHFKVIELNPNNGDIKRQFEKLLVNNIN